MSYLFQNTNIKDKPLNILEENIELGQKDLQQVLLWPLNQYHGSTKTFTLFM